MTVNEYYDRASLICMICDKIWQIYIYDAGVHCNLTFFTTGVYKGPMIVTWRTFNTPNAGAGSGARRYVTSLLLRTCTSLPSGSFCVWQPQNGAACISKAEDAWCCCHVWYVYVCWLYAIHPILYVAAFYTVFRKKWYILFVKITSQLQARFSYSFQWQLLSN